MNQLVEATLATLVDRIENGTGAWINDWVGGGSPVNAVTKKHYSGVNILLLWAAKEKAAYSCGEWATYKQWQSTGMQVREGERSNIIFISKDAVKKGGDKENPDDRYRLLKCAFVFNADQLVERPASPPTVGEGDRLAHCEALVAATGAVINETDNAIACYRLRQDVIEVPTFDTFLSAEGYYATVLHELVHWTSHKDRLDRDISLYAQEELVAELGSAFLCAELGLEYNDNAAAYLRSWLKHIKTDKAKALMSAASAGSKAREFILATQQKEIAMAS